MVAVSRLGVIAEEGVKAPARVQTTTNITLFGLQTVNTVALQTNDRVLVKDQTDPIENGIYNAKPEGWERANDLNRPEDVNRGVFIISQLDGNLYFIDVPAGTYWNPDSTAINFTPVAFAATWGGIVGTLSNQSDLQTELNLKTDLTTFNAHTADGTIHFTQATINIAQSQVTNLITDLGLKAPLASPTFTGNFTSTGINDDATAERLRLLNGALTLGVNDVTFFSIQKAGNTGGLGITGGTSLGVGGEALFYSGAHSSQAGDFILRSGGGEVIKWDESAGSLTFNTLTGISKTLAMTIDSAQNAEIFGNLTLDDVSPTLNLDGNSTGQPIITYTQNGLQRAWHQFVNSTGRLVFNTSLAGSGFEFRPDDNSGLYLMEVATFKAGNFTFNIDQVVGAAQDEFVLTYDNASGEISLAESTGSGTGFLLIGA